MLPISISANILHRVVRCCFNWILDKTSSTSRSMVDHDSRYGFVGMRRNNSGSTVAVFGVTATLLLKVVSVAMVLVVTE